jgi:hypothetical protein
MTASRTHLPNRRQHWLYRFECDGQSFTGGIGRRWSDRGDFHQWIEGRIGR